MTKFELTFAEARANWPADECWDWPHGTFGAGRYGATKVDGVNRGVHCVAYAREYGPIPEGMTIDHLCRNKRCFNPRHLEAVSRGENVLRGDGVTARNARKTECKRGHPLAGDNLFYKRGTRQCRACHNLRARGYRARHG